MKRIRMTAVMGLVSSELVMTVIPTFGSVSVKKTGNIRSFFSFSFGDISVGKLLWCMLLTKLETIGFYVTSYKYNGCRTLCFYNLKPL